MYKKMTAEQAMEIAASLVPANHFGYNTKVIDQHWEVDLFTGNSLASFLDIPQGKGLIRIYERLELLEFVVSKSEIIDVTREAVAKCIQEHINGCIDEWIEEGVNVHTDFLS